MALAAVTAPRRSREGPSRSRHTRGTPTVALNESGRISVIPMRETWRWEPEPAADGGH